MFPSGYALFKDLKVITKHVLYKYPRLNPGNVPIDLYAGDLTDRFMCLLEHLRRLKNPVKYQEATTRLTVPEIATIDSMLADLPEPEGDDIGDSCGAALA
eukprot:5274754-Lingulodinium_polyedra.AAC.1